MTDEGTYRPEKRPINASEIDNQSKLDMVSQVKAAVSSTDGLKITGRVPAEFLKAQQRQSGQAEIQDSPQQLQSGSKLQQLIGAIQNSVNVYDTVELPSKGVFYNGEDGPHDGKVQIRPMTGEEEQILATPRFVKNGDAVNMIFNRCMNNMYDATNFLTPDRTFLLIYLRGISYTPHYDVEVTCPICDRKFSTVINLNSDVELEKCPHDFNQNSLSGVLPTTKLNLRYNLSKGSDEKRVNEYRDKRMKFDTSNQADDTLLYRTAMLIQEIGASDGSPGITQTHEIVQLLKRLPINDVSFLRNTINDPPFGVDTKIEIPCPGCLSDFEIELPLETNFFFPKPKKTNRSSSQA